MHDKNATVLASFLLSYKDLFWLFKLKKSNLASLFLFKKVFVMLTQNKILFDIIAMTRR